MGDTKQIEIISRGLIQQRRWVLVCRDLEGGYLYLPGGHVEPGEASATAIERELMEEAGMQTTAGECLLVCEQMFNQKGKARHEINMVFHVDPPPLSHLPTQHDSNLDCPPPIKSLEDHIAFEWIEQAALADADLRPTVIRAWLVSGGALGDTNRPGWISTRE